MHIELIDLKNVKMLINFYIFNSELRFFIGPKVKNCLKPFYHQNNIIISKMV